MEAFLELVRDVWDFLKTRTKILVSTFNYYQHFNGCLNYFTQGSVVAPFIYSIS